MTAQQYKAFLHRISQREDQAHHALDQSLHARNVDDLEHALTAFADDQSSDATDLSRVTPPANARAANSDLIKGLRDTASGMRGVLPQVAAASTSQAALKALQAAKAPQQAGQEVDSALAELKRLGYISQIS
jgi:Asp-tRNA(Asn)/Glu-tRNA(Gln) amidotransferase A subunit family amidase